MSRDLEESRLTDATVVQLTRHLGRLPADNDRQAQDEELSTPIPGAFQKPFRDLEVKRPVCYTV
jgi:hypothetical protein